MSLLTRLTPRFFVWVVRVLSAALAGCMALAINEAGHTRSSAAGPVAITAWAALVGVVIVSEVALGSLGLTLVRVLLPAAIPAALVALAVGSQPLWGIVSATGALLATLAAFSPETAEAFVQAAAYGDERRLPLRAPATTLLPMGVTWVLWCAAALGAVLLLGARQWLAGGALSVAAGGLSWLLVSRCKPFATRWLVLVPAGVVIHDSVVLGETLMVHRANIAWARLAESDTAAADLTGPAAGHLVEIGVIEMVLAVMAGTRAQPKGAALHVQSLLVAPSRPGQALLALAAAKVPVG